MRILVALVLAACNGTAGTRDHAEALVVATPCEDHGCPTAPHARALGDGCYVVRDRLLDRRAARRPGIVLRDPVVRLRGHDHEAQPQRWRVDREAHRSPPTCSPVRVEVAIGSAMAGPSSALPLPAALVTEVIRSDKGRFVYEARRSHPEGAGHDRRHARRTHPDGVDVAVIVEGVADAWTAALAFAGCAILASATPSGVVVGEATHVAGFAELDRALRGRVAGVPVAPGQCATIALVASHFDCGVEKTLD